VSMTVAPDSSTSRSPWTRIQGSSGIAPPPRVSGHHSNRSPTLL
jgi:hypothetical protein